MPFGVKKLIRFNKYGWFIIAFVTAITIHQTQAQGLQRGGVKKDTLLKDNDLVVDSLLGNPTDTIQKAAAVKLSYKQRYQSIQFTKNLDLLNYQQLDTTYQYFHQFNPANRHQFERYAIGPLGAPAYNLLPNFEQKLNFNLGMNQFKPYQFNKDSIAIFKLNAPYTYLNWIFGTKAHQSFEVLHANRIKDLAQFGLRFRRMGGEGYYAQQKTGHSDFSAYLSYDSPNKQYKNIFTLLHNKYAFEQNGGIKEDSIFAQEERRAINRRGDTIDILVPNTRVFRRDLVPVFLDDAISREKKWNFAFNQYFNFGKYLNEAVNDTSYLKQDSIQQQDSIYIKRFVPQFRLKHRIAFSNEYYTYEDVNGGQFSLYPNNLINEANYYVDSIQQKTWHHELAIIQTGKSAKEGELKQVEINKVNPHKPIERIHAQKRKLKQQPINSYLGLHMENVRITQQFNFDTARINYVWLQANISGKAFKRLKYNLDLQYALFDNRVQQKIHYLKAHIDYDLQSDMGSVGVKYLNNRYKSPYLHNTNRSNFYIWNKTFPLSSTQQIEGFYQNKAVNLYASYQQILFDDLVVLDTTTSQITRSYIAWDKDSVHVIKNISENSSGIQFRSTSGTVHRFNLHKTIKLGWWRMRHQFHFQTTQNELLFMPKIVYQGTWYYSGNWFKRALDFNVGIDVRYTSNFNLPVYHPVLGQFFAQQEDTFQFYPSIDFFFNFKIKSATFFFKAAYVNQGLFQRGYYAAYNYPQADIAIQGGISWRFFD